MAKITDEIKKYFSDLAKDSHKKSPRTKEYYSAIAKKRWAKKKLSTPKPL